MPGVTWWKLTNSIMVRRAGRKPTFARPAASVSLGSKPTFAARCTNDRCQLRVGFHTLPQTTRYVWTINGQTWGSHVPVTAKSGDRVEIMFHNMSMMAHPMHLHGHAFQVVGVGMDRIAGAVRDTVHVPPMGMVTVAVDAGEAARWMLHCHHMPHLSTGMMTEFAVSA